MKNKIKINLVSPDLEIYDDVAVIGLFVNPTWAIYHQYVRPFIVPWYYFDQPHQWTTNK